MKNGILRITALFIAAALIITGTPVYVPAYEGDILTGNETELQQDMVSAEDIILPEDVVSTEDIISAEDIVSTENTVSSEDVVSSEDMIPPEDIISSGEITFTLSGNAALSENRTGEPLTIPEEILNYHDVDLNLEDSGIGYRSPGTGEDAFSRRDRGTTIPSAYRTDNTLLTEIKNQNPFGACWAFSTMASCEVSLAKKYGLEPASLDLSERALCYFFYNLKDINDPQGNTLNDYHTAILGTEHDIYQLGGNVPMASIFLANWGGPVDEAKAPYSRLVEIGKYGNLTTDETKGDDALDPALCYDASYHVQNVRLIDKTDSNGIKQAIMDNGIVSRSYYHRDSYLNSSTGAYNSGKTYSNTNHAITLIGWNDDYSRENFTNMPDENGAWLVRNSWGSSFGDGGYMWISYEDTSLGDATVISCEPGDNYDNNYFYDGTAALASVNGSNDDGGAWCAANVFTAGSPEVLKAVSFAMKSTDVPYSVQIYKDLKDKMDPSSGSPMLDTPVTGTTSYAGYYTVPLGTAIPLSEGDTFSVVFTFGTEGSPKISAFTEKTYNYSWLKWNAGIDEGQSFFKYADSTAWYDMYQLNACFRIHAFTDLDDESFFVEHNGTEDIKNAVSQVTGPLTVRKGGSSSYYIEDDTFEQGIRVTSSDPATLSVKSPVTSGGVRRIELTPKKVGTVTLTVYFGSNVTAGRELTVLVYDRAVNLSKSALKINTAMSDKYDTLELENLYDRKISLVTLEGADGFTTEYTGNELDNSGILKIRYTGSPIKKTIDVTLKISFMGEDDPISRKINITLNNIKPAITVTTVSKVDWLYAPEPGQGELKIRVNTGKIKNIIFTDSGRNGKTAGVLNPLSYEATAPDIEADGLSARLKIRSKAGGNPRYSKGRISVYLEDYTEPVEKEIGIAYTTSRLRPTVTSTSLLTASGKIIGGGRIEIGVRNTTAGRIQTFESPSVTINDKQSGAVLTSKYNPAYSGGLIVMTPPAGGDLTSKGEMINITIEDASLASPYVISGFRVNATDVSRMALALGRSSLVMNYWDGDQDVNKAVEVSTPLTIRGCLGLNEYLGNMYRIEGADDKSRQALDNGNISVSYVPSEGLVKAFFPEGNAPERGTYKYKLILDRTKTGASKDITASLNLSVRKLDKQRAAACRVSVVGKLDVLDRTGLVCFRPTYNNLPAPYKVTNVVLAGEDADKFRIDSHADDGQAWISLKPGVEYNTTTKYKLAIKYTLKMGEAEFVSTASFNNFTVSQGRVTFRVLASTDTFGPSARSEAVTIKAYNAKGQEIDVSNIGLLNPNKDFTLTDNGGGTCLLNYSPNGAIKAGGIYTPRFAVTLKDKAVNTSIPTTTGYRIRIASH